jgi:hypothetical protein
VLVSYRRRRGSLTARDLQLRLASLRYRVERYAPRVARERRGAVYLAFALAAAWRGPRGFRLASAWRRRALQASLASTLRWSGDWKRVVLLLLGPAAAYACHHLESILLRPETTRLARRP